MENWKGHGEKDRREQSERRELEKGVGGKKRAFKIPRAEPWMKAAEGQVVSQGRVGRGGGEGSTGDLREKRQRQGWRGTCRDQVLPQGRLHTLSSVPAPGRALPWPEGHELQFGGGVGACQPAEMRAEEEEGAGEAEQARRAEPGVCTGAQERCPFRSGLPSLSEQMP